MRYRWLANACVLWVVAGTGCSTATSGAHDVAGHDASGVGPDLGHDLPTSADATTSHDGDVTATDGARASDTTPAVDAGFVDAGPDAVSLPPGVLGPFALGTCDGVSYSVETNIGSQTFRLLVDTGSATVAVASTKCSNCTADPNPAYLPGASAMDLSRTSSLIYDDGTGWSGEVYQDNVQLTGMMTPVSMSLAAITQQMDFIVAPSQCADGSTYEEDGILGLGVKGSGAPNTDDFLDQLSAMYPGMGQSFAFQLCPDGGQLWFGGYDPAATAGPMQLTPMLPIDMINNPYYSVTINDLAFNGTSLGFGAADFGAAAVDSGTTLLDVPQPVYDALTALVLQNADFRTFVTTDATFFSGGFCYPPSVPALELNVRLPKLTLQLPAKGGGAPVSVDLPALSSYLTYEADGSGGLLVCSGLEVATDGTTIGDAVLSGLITLIDRQANVVGFAPQRGCR